jgi:cell division protein FtsI/penicillin-binding protein 2
VRTPTRTIPPRRIVALLLTSALALPLTACSGPDVPPPDPAAKALVSALQHGKLDGVELATDTSSDPQTQLTEILASLLKASGASQAQVELTKVAVAQEGDDADHHATATLQWTWPLGGAEWTYLTRAELAYEDPPKGADKGTWVTAWQPSILAPDLAPGERIKVKRVPGERADILDGTGEPLVTTRPVYRLGVDKTHVGAGEWESSAKALARLVAEGGVPLDPDEYAKRVLGAGPKAFVEAVTVRQSGSDVDVESAREIPGVSALAGELELAPTADFARAILGRSGDATAEIIEKSKGRIHAGDTAGLSGLQRQYDAQLAGAAGVVVTAESASDGDAVAHAAASGDASASPSGDASAAPDGPRELFRKDAVDGTPLQTTFDVALQERAERVLADVTPASAIVAIRPSTGEVLAAASGPGSEGANTATLGKFAPGSTFKVADALAFGRAGVTPTSTVPCTPTITVNGRPFSNVPRYPASALGDVPFRTAFAHSCNTAMISQHDKVSQPDLVAAAADLGIGVDTALGAPAFLGNVPSDATPAEHAASLIGQGRIEVSPLTMARVAASVAAGHRVDPVLVRPSAKAKSKAVPDSKLTEGEAKTLRLLMNAVVTDGSASMLKGVRGIVGAKTGTAQFGDGKKQHVWMIAIAGDLAVAVFVEEGYRGSTDAGPLMKAFLTGS